MIASIDDERSRTSGSSPLLALPSFDDVFNAHARYVGRTLRYLGVPEADVEDACQEVFLVVHRRLEELDPARAAEGSTAWVRRICVHVAQNQRRSARRRRELPVDPAPEPGGPATQHEAAERVELRDRLLELLRSLSDEQRAVFVLYEVERMTMGEVASTLGCPLQTAYSRLHAARARLEAALVEESTP